MSSPLKDQFEPAVYELPRSEEDPAYVISHTIDDAEGIKFFFEKFGFVIIRDAFTPEECGRSIDDIWTYIEQRGFSRLASEHCIKRTDPSTWINKYWAPMYNEGIVGSPPVFTASALLNRQNPTIYRAASILLGREDLFVNHDRYGMFRPTIDVMGANEDGQVHSYGNHPEWKTAKNLHIDMNPWRYFADTDSSHAELALGGLRYDADSDFLDENNEVSCMKENKINIQGLINFADNTLLDGGFQVVPGFHHYINEWAAASSLEGRYGRDTSFILMSAKDAVHKNAVRLTCRAGSIILWDQRLAHGSAPNNSTNPRFAQFFKVFPANPMDPERREARAAKLAQKVASAGCKDQITELGEKMFGLKQ